MALKTFKAKQKLAQVQAHGHERKKRCIRNGRRSWRRRRNEVVKVKGACLYVTCAVYNGQHKGFSEKTSTRMGIFFTFSQLLRESFTRKLIKLQFEVNKLGNNL